jgi:hypothetical protein
LVPKSVFDQSVFEGMEADDHRASAGLHPIGQRAGEELLEVLEFVVDGDPQGLKDAGRGMGFVTVFWPARKSVRDSRNEIG